jgi:hypothetical protein
MNIRGGNGYIEEWVNARLVRDSFLGSIWEGAENVVALDIARAATKGRAHEALFGDLSAKLDPLRDPDVRREAAPLRDALAATKSRLEQLLLVSPDEREPKMTRMADRMAAVACAVLLMVDADAQAKAGDGYRKLLVATEYRRRNVDGGDPLDWATAGVRWLDEILDWKPIPAEAVRGG